ncbi:hypothetical protein Q7A53_06070 [Halobacillus rhizosphaerae]|uniref:hypothetical protein n=1 Tax=Halobacillus rhizosphaerae TaxID=3064889 RepID=UPI00398B39B4
MLNLFRYMLENNMTTLAEIYEPYQTNLRNEYSQKVVDGEITEARYKEITGEDYVAPEVQ